MLGLDEVSPSVTLSLCLSAGDTIDFVVGDGNNGYTNDSTGVWAEVCPHRGADGG